MAGGPARQIYYQRGGSTAEAMPTQVRKETIRLPALFVSNVGSVNSNTRGAWKPTLDSQGRCVESPCGRELVATTQSEELDREMRLPAIATAHSTRNLTIEATAWSPSRGGESERTTRIGAACGGPDVAFMVRNNRHVRLDHLQALEVIPAGQLPRKRKLMATPDADGRGSPGWGKRSPFEVARTALRRPTSADSDYDIDSETLCYSLTLPTIEAVLTEEGISSHSISQQMAQIRERCRSRYNREPPIFPRSQLNELRLPPRSLDSLSEPPATRATPRPSLLTALLTDRLRVASPRRGALPSASNDKLSASVPVAPHLPGINVLNNDVQRNIDDFLDEIERTKWLSRQQLESTNMGPWFVAPRIVVVPSNVLYGSSLLENVVRRSESVLTVDYDFQTATYDTVLGLIKRKLDSYQKNCRARSLVFYCKGGPGFIYMVNKRVVTPQKLQKQLDLQAFWREIGELMTKIDHTQTKVHIAGCDLLGNRQGYDLLTDISKLMYPNMVGIEAADETTWSEAAGQILGLYLDYDKYMSWKAAVELIKRELEKSPDYDTLPALQALSS